MLARTAILTVQTYPSWGVSGSLDWTTVIPFLFKTEGWSTNKALCIQTCRAMSRIWLPGKDYGAGHIHSYMIWRGDWKTLGRKLFCHSLWGAPPLRPGWVQPCKPGTTVPRPVIQLRQINSTNETGPTEQYSNSKVRPAPLAKSHKKQRL